MKSFVLFLQIGELFEGHFSWRGFLYLCLFLLMGLVAIGFAVFIGYKAFQSKSKKKDGV